MSDTAPPPPTTVSPAGLALVQHFEGLRLTAYRCPAGVLTVGWGHTGPDVTEGQIITEHQAQLALAHDLAHAAADVRRLVMGPLAQCQFDALVSFVFNVGASALATSTLLKRLNAGDYAAVPHELMRWNKVDGEVCHGLVLRRSAEARLWDGTSPMPQRVDSPEPTS